MRVYVPVTAVDVKRFLETGTLASLEVFEVNQEFIHENPELDQEECEYLRSLDAAQASLVDSDRGLVLALELEASTAPKPADIDCLFSCTLGEDGEIELTWFGPSEIEHHLPQWLAQ